MKTTPNKNYNCFWHIEKVEDHELHHFCINPNCDNIAYFCENCPHYICKDAAADIILKYQKEKRAGSAPFRSKEAVATYCCGNCKEELYSSNELYCHHCGTMIIWEDKYD